MDIHERINQDFAAHEVNDEQVTRMSAIRSGAGHLAHLIAGRTPAGREQSLALTNLEQAVMWANAAVARHG